MDLARSTQYTLNSCIEYCVYYNKIPGNNASACQGVTYQPNLTASFGGGQDGNCFLKNHIGKYYPTGNGGMSAGIIGV